MSAGRDEGPVYYREIQKNAFLKRIPNDVGGSKLRPLGHKKPPLKPLWTLFCVHNGRTPFLEQYPEPESPATLNHKPLWRACLKTARHVTASVKPHVGDEYDFLIDTDHGPVRMLAPDWESMQDWVTTLRSKLHELKILSKGENVYCAPPAAPPPRAAARDPTSPLPPTPPVPPDRVPGIELTTPVRSQPQEVTPPEPTPELLDPDIDISNWDTPFNSLPNTSITSIPSTSQASNTQEETREKKLEPKKSVAKICGQNICLDDSILKRHQNPGSTESDEEFFAEIDRINESVENLDIDKNEPRPEPRAEQESEPRTEYKQTVLVNDKPGLSRALSESGESSDHQTTNITVIQVSNKPPHTAIPVLGPETDIFDFTFQRNLPVNDCQTVNHSDSNMPSVNHSDIVKVNLKPVNDAPTTSGMDNITSNFVNIVNTEVNVTENGYGTVFDKDSEYGHLSLTTTVNLTGQPVDSSGQPVDLSRQPVSLTRQHVDSSRQPASSAREPVNSRLDGEDEGIYEKLCLASTSVNTASPLPIRKIKNTDKHRKSSLPNLDVSLSESAYEYLFPNNHNTITLNSEQNVTVNSDGHRNNNLNTSDTRTGNDRLIKTDIRNRVTSEIRNNEAPISINNENLRRYENIGNDNSRDNYHNRVNMINSPVNITNTHVNVSNLPANVAEQRRSAVERSHSQNAYDSSPRLRELIRRQNCSPKRDNRNDKTEAPPKPIWKRGLTELSLLSRLRGIGQGKRQESPTRHDSENDRGVTSPSKVVHRSRPEGRGDNTRRRSSSLSNGQSPPSAAPPLQPLRARQAAGLRAEQRRGAAVPAALPVRDPPIFVGYDRQVWIAWWSAGGVRFGGRAGDRVAAVRGIPPRDANHARQLVKSSPSHVVDILFHRVPLGKIYVLNKRDLESIGIKLDSECNITSVESQSPAARAGIHPPGKWAVTEVNNRPINLIKGGEEEMNRISAHGSEVSVLIQPSPLVKKIRAAVKASRPLLSMR